MEQEREIQSLLTLLLSDIKECQLEICSPPTDLLTRVHETDPGLVLLNVGERNPQAHSVLSEIHHGNPGVYVIVSIPERSAESIDSFIAAGAHDCVLRDRNFVPNMVSAVKKALIRIAEREAFELPVLARAQRFAMDENLPDIIFSLDLDGNILYANHAITILLGHEQNQIVGTKFANLIANEIEQANFRDYLNQVSQNVNFREIVLLKDSREREVKYDINFTLMEGEIIYGVARKVKEQQDERQGILAEESPVLSPSPLADAIPARLGPYRIVTLLGAGSMGRVYKGFDEQLERYVAIKVISRSLAENQNYVDRFRREAKILASISHPNIALIYYFGSLDGLPYFCMEYLANGSLESILDSGERIDPQTAVSYLIQVSSGLREALSKGVLHMDIKPSNLMLAEDGRLKVVDFGLAQSNRDLSTLESNIVGTPMYIAPEQIVGGVADFRMDIYSLGVTFFEMLYGVAPFRGSNVPEIFQAKLRNVIPQRSELSSAVPSGFYELVSRMMARDPLQRHANYSELLEDLEKLRRSSVPVQTEPEVERPASGNISLRGLLHDHSIPEVFGLIAQQQLNGRLTINWGQLVKQLHFKNGKLIAILSNQEGEDFMELVISQLPSEARLMRKLQTSQTSDLYKGYSTAIEKISGRFRAQISADLHEKAEKILEALFRWRTGEFIFEAGDYAGQLDLSIDLQGCITRGVKQWLDYDFIRSNVYDGNCTIRIDLDFIPKLRNLNLAPSDRFLLFRFETETQYRDLLQISGISEEEFASLIYLFRCYGLVHLVRNLQASAESNRQPVVQPAATAEPQPAPGNTTTDLATYYTHCAVKSFGERNFWACAEYCRKAVEHRQDPNVYRLLGRALATHARFRQEALDAYKTALELSPNHDGIERDIADLYFDSGSFALAKTKYEMLLKQNPADHHSTKRLQEINRRRR